MAEISEEQRLARKQRVQTLKKLIILLLITSILIPIFLCIFLFVRISVLEGQVGELKEMIQVLQISQESVQAEKSLVKQEAMTGFILDTKEEAIGAETFDIQEQDEVSYRKVYLTFDDGPSAYTDEILDILAEYGVKATFFVIGKEDEKSQEALKRIVEEGHTLGMHSYSHKYSEIYASKEAFAEDVSRLQEYLYEVTGAWSRIYRFPGGSSNTVSKTDMHELIDYLNEQGIAYYDWNITSKDATKGQLSAKEIIANSTKDMNKHNNAIILMHDAADKSTTIEALPTILENILAMEDTVILPITDDTVPIQHITNN